MTDELHTEVTVPVTHVKIVVNRSFDQVHEAFESILPKLADTGRAMLQAGEVEKARQTLESLPALSIFQSRNHGVLLRIAGLSRKALQYDIGNPNTASKMTRDELAAAQYAPFRVVLYEDAQGRAVFEYDKPSSLFGQFGVSEVTEIAHGLDVAIERAIREAGSPMEPSKANRQLSEERGQ